MFAGLAGMQALFFLCWLLAGEVCLRILHFMQNSCGVLQGGSIM